MKGSFFSAIVDSSLFLCSGHHLNNITVKCASYLVQYTIGCSQVHHFALEDEVLLSGQQQSSLDIQKLFPSTVVNIAIHQILSPLACPPRSRPVISSGSQEPMYDLVQVINVSSLLSRIN